MATYFLYARKSTDVEDKQVRSIEDQLAVLRSLAKSDSLTITSEFIEKQSAKRPGRPVFNDMVSRIQNGEASGIICWKLDRLARNPVDAAQIQWLLQEGTIQHIQAHDRSYRSADNVMLMNVEFGIANQYIRDLSSNTKRGLYEKAKRGEYPGLAPLGYINDLRKKKIVLDKQKAPIIKAAFERYSQNQYSLEDISVFLFAQGISTKKIVRTNSKGGNPMKRDQVGYILSNPFYCGLFRYGGELFQGKHEPVISKQLFDRVQAVMKQRGRIVKTRPDPKPFCGLLKCGECGRSITAEKRIKHQKNGTTHEYLYYRCTKKNTICSQPHIRSEALEEQLSTMLQSFSMPKEWADEFQKMADQDERDIKQTNGAIIHNLKRKIEEIDQKLERLFDMHLDQEIERGQYLQKKNQLTLEKKTLSEKITNLEYKDTLWLEPLREWVKEAESLGEVATAPSLETKKSAARSIAGSNLFLKNQKIEFTPKMQWAALSAALQKYSENPDCNILVGRVGIEPTTNGLKGHCSTD